MAVSSKSGKQRTTRQRASAQARISKLLAYEFNDPGLLERALSHRSSEGPSYERLEFLGDSILNFLISEELYRNNTALDEGALSRLRASLVSGVSLAQIARDLDIGKFLNMGAGELRSGGFDRDSVLADVIESLIAAVYLDGGIDESRNFVMRLFEGRLGNLPTPSELKDAKTRLQEKLQARGYDLPTYVLVDTQGKAHQRSFTVECRVDALNKTELAQGSSRRKAEQEAAARMLGALPEKLHKKRRQRA